MFFKKKKKEIKAEPPKSTTYITKKGDSIEIDNEERTVSINPNKQDYDGRIIQKSPNGIFYLSDGIGKTGDTYISFFTKEEMYIYKKFEDGIVFSKVFDSGLALIYSDEQKIIKINKNDFSQKKIGVDLDEETSCIATEEIFCIYGLSEYGEGLLKVLNFQTNKIWFKKFKYEEDDSEVFPGILKHDSINHTVTISIPNGILKIFDYEGEVIN